MTVSKILQEKGVGVVHVDARTPLMDVADIMSKHAIGAVLVLDTVRQVLGIVSERDILRCLSRHRAQTLSMTAAQIMTPNVVTVTRETSPLRAMQIMTDGRFRHLPVMEGCRLVGLVSMGDIVKHRLAEQEDEVDTLKAYVGGVM